ncbi:HlyD family type I secretion periplasmic adaptor subunit [Salaquimonas pukyongi]|uniref:HlyD family type I secretion periplasmic adaptor subunit n=1 Tax=Salaquimonas pukyongi TaxID=2712698 RepID=UPI00096BB512|nr:HlyD family type I secretion periplasmic adaptor subunit [Salaquimonas pukyongi]
MKLFRRPMKAGNATASTAPGGEGWKSAVDADTGAIARTGYRWVGIAFGLFMLWALLFPISSAVVAGGSVISKGRNKLLQHPTGGVVQDILAQNGDRLDAGEPVLRIDPSAARAELVRLKARQDLLLAQKSRLTSMRDAETAYRQSDPITVSSLRGTLSREAANRALSKTGAKEIYAEQETEFLAARQRVISELSALRNRLASQQEELEGVEWQITERRELVVLLADEVERMRPLAASGYVARARFDERQVRYLGEKAQLGELRSRALGLRAQIDETSDRITTLDASWQEENARELSSVLSELAAVNEQMEAARMAVDLTEIKAPVAGTLVKFEANTVGGVIGSGKPFGEIVPAGTPVLVEAKVLPQDIANVVAGQETEVVITAFNRRVQEPIVGKVDYVPADSTTDPVTGEPYFAVQVDIAEAQQDLVQKVQPGMLAEVYIHTGERSFLSYVAEPISESFMKAFRER